MKRQSRLYALSLGTLTALVACLFTAPALGDGSSDDKVDVGRETQGVSFGHAVSVSVPDYYGVEPKLAVTYNANGPVGLAGPGWNLAGFSVIDKRGPSHGIPQYGSTDRLFLDGQELIACSSTTGSPGCAAGGTHATKLESFSKIVRTGDTFTVCKDGVCTAYAPIVCTPRGIFRWGVSSVTDNLGHSTLYTWDTSNSCNGSAGPGTGTPAYAYPKSVSYNGSKFGISIFYENSVQRFPMATGESDIVLTKRLKSIDVTVTGARRGAYGLSYQAGTDILTKIQPYGTDASLDATGSILSGSTALPAQTFVMAAPTLGFGAGAAAAGIVCPPDASLSPVDLNGDGFTDFVCVDAKTGSGDTNNRILIYLNNRTGGYAAATTLPYPNTKKPPMLVDINCDHRPDLVYISTTCPQQWRGLLNDGAGAFGTTDVPLGNLPTDVDLAFSAQFTDLNGDSCTDVVYPSTLSGPAYRSYKVVYGKQAEGNTCLGTEQFLLDHPADAAAESVLLPRPLRFTDVDGNGAADVLYFKNTTTNTSAELKALLGTGYAMNGPTVSLGVMSEFEGLSNLTFSRFAMGRGSDMVYLKAGTRNIMVRPWSDATQAFGAATIVGSAPTGVPIVSLMTGDFNGDGRQDIVTVANDGSGTITPYVFLNQSGDPRLTEIRNGLGGYRKIAYANAASMPNTYDIPTQMVVKSVVESVGDGREFTTTFDYDQGYYDPFEKRFLGFWKVSRTEPCVATVCPRSTIYFDIDYTGARPSRIDRTDTAGKVWQSTVLRYGAKTTLPYDNPVTEKWTFRYATSATSAFRQAFAYTYDAFGRTTSVTDYGQGTVPLRVTVNEYTPMSASYISKLARKALYEGSVSDPQKRSENRYTYNADGTMATSDVWASPAPVGTTNPYLTTTYGYDAQARLVQTTAPVGRVTTVTYEPTLGIDVATRTNPANQVETTIWDAKCRKPVSVTAINGTVTAFTYDAFCRETSKTHSSGGFERTTYVPVGTSAQHVLVERPSADGAGNAWVDTYLDGDNRPIEIRTKGPRTIVVRKTYDAQGNLATESQPFYDGDAVYSTSYKYDVLGRKTQTLYASGKTVGVEYGAISTCVTDEQGHLSCDEFNSLGYRSLHREFDGTRWIGTTFQYTTSGDVRQITDALGNVTKYTLDTLGRKVSETDPVTGTTTTAYTMAGPMDRQTNALGETTTYTYDALNRMRSKTTRSGTAGAKTNTYEYDTVQSGYTNIGQLTKTTDAVGSTTLYYNNAGKLIRHVRAFVSDGDTPPAAQSTTFTFDAGGRLTRMNSLDNTAAQWTYDAAGRPISLSLALTSPTAFQSVATAQYDAAGQATRIDYPSAYTTYTYEPTRHFLSAMKTTATAPTVRDLAALTYVRDGEGHITSVTETIGGTTDQITYSYDKRHELLSAASTLNGTQTWSYDDIGRMVGSPFGNNCYDAGTTAYPAPHALRGAGTCTTPAYAYNAIGSLLSGPVLPNDSTAGTRTLSYDGDGRLEQVSLVVPGTADPYVESYKYDAGGARIRVTSRSAPTAVPSNTYYFGDDFEFTRKLGGDSLTQYYALGAVKVAKRTRVGTVDRLTFEHADHLGSVVVESDATGAVVSSLDYQAFGDERVGTVGASASRHRGYIGQMQDATGLLYLNARYYDPAIARFVSADPVRAVDTTLGLHPYAYSQNDPINRSDPTGEMSVAEEGGATQSASDGKAPEGGRFRDSLGRFFDRLGVFIDAINDRVSIDYPDPSGEADTVIRISMFDNFARGGLNFGEKAAGGAAKKIFVAGRTEVIDEAAYAIKAVEKDAKVMMYFDDLVGNGFASLDDYTKSITGNWGSIYPAVVRNSDQIVFDLRGMKYNPMRRASDWWQSPMTVGGFEVRGTLTDSELHWFYTQAGHGEIGKVFFRNIPSNFPVPMITPPSWRKGGP